MRLIKMKIKITGLIIGLLGFSFGASVAKPIADTKDSLQVQRIGQSDIVARAMEQVELAVQPKLSKEAAEQRKQVRKERIRKALEMGEVEKKRIKKEVAARDQAQKERSSEVVEDNRKKAESGKTVLNSANANPATSGNQP